MKKASGLRLPRLRSCLVGLVAVAAMPGVADAQAWVEGKGALGASATYIGATSDDLVAPNGNTYDVDDLSITNHTLTLGLSYVPLEKLGLTLDLPLLAVKYGGDQDGFFPPHGEYDDGDYHFTPTDARLGVRYQFLEGLKAIAPHLAISVPVVDYPITGFAGAGRGIIKGHVGVSGGIVLDPWVPNLYFHGTGEFSIGTTPTVDDPRFEEDALDEYSQNAIDLSASVGYFIGEKLTVSLTVGAHFQQDGVTLDEVPPSEDELLFAFHDSVLDEDYIHPGLDLSYNLTDALSLSGHFRMFATGSNTRNLIGGGLGLSYTIIDPAIVDYAGDWEDDEWEDEEWDEEGEGDVSGEVEAGVNVDASVDAEAEAEVEADESSPDDGAEP